MENLIRFLLISCIFSSCTQNKKVDVWGFAYRGEEVIIKMNDEIVKKFRTNGIEDLNKVGSFHEEVSLPLIKDHLRFNVIIDSNGTKVLDTVVIISGSSKNPYISILDPSINYPFKRALFVADDRDRIKLTKDLQKLHEQKKSKRGTNDSN